jgi:hypothetical protein
MTFYSKPPTQSVLEARAQAQRIAFAPVIFQAARTMRELGILEFIRKSRNTGRSAQEVADELGLSLYGVKVLLDMGLSIGIVWWNEERYCLTQVGKVILKDPLTRINMDFVHDVCYRGFFHLQESIEQGTPAGLQVFEQEGNIYRALSSLPENVQKSWFDFDHYYSDLAFPDVLPIIFAEQPRHILDVGGNTGKWAIQCAQYSEDVRLTILDLPGQLEKAIRNIESHALQDRIDTITIDLLQQSQPFPANADIIWMSQFLDCFSEEEILAILCRARQAMADHTSLFILEAYWDRQPFEAGAFSVNSLSLYFTCMANGNSRMYHSKDMLKLLHKAGLVVVNDIDDLGIGHTLFQCKKMPQNKANSGA